MRILRPGPITLEDLVPFGPVDPFVARSDARPEVPGSLESHYAPSTALRLESASHRLAPRAGARSGLISWDPALSARGFTRVDLWSPRRDLREAATRLFALLREFDAAGLDEIVVQAVPEEGLGVAINDRLRRAAAGGER